MSAVSRESDGVQPKERVVSRLEEADLLENRLIPVEDGSKASKVNHHKSKNRHSSFDRLHGNYGVYAGATPSGDKWLIDVDIDDYETDSEALDPVTELPETLTVASPHTDGVSGGHRYYAVVCDDLPGKVEDLTGKYNPKPSWGSLRTKNQYVVGPGSQLDGCDKEWCDKCEKPDGGKYEIAKDAPIAELDPEQVLEVLRADGYDEEAEETDSDDYTPDSSDTNRAKRVVEEERWIADYLALGPEDGDRSKKDFAVCRTMIEYGVPESQVRDLLNGSNKTKVAERGSDYWRSTWNEALRKADKNTKRLPGDSSDREPKGEDGNPDLTKAEIMVRLGYDPEEQSFRKIPNNEIANAIDEILSERDDYHFRVVDDKTEDIFAYESDTGIWRQNGERKLKQVAKQVLRYQNKQTIHGELIHAVESDERRAISRDQLGAPEGYIGVKNGLLDLRERELREPTPDDYLLGRIPTAYDPNASIDGTHFEDYLLQSVAPADRDKLQEYAGYCLWHRGQPFKKTIFLIGPTDSGKGTFLETIELVIGDENTAWQGLSDLMGRWGLAKIYGKMVNMSDEVDDGLSNVKSFKQMTGGEDTVTAEHKGERTFEFTVTQKFLFATNKFPTPEDAEEPFFNRCLFAEFPNTVPGDEQDRSLKEKFKQERSAILNWMLDGLDRLFEQGHFSGERSITEKREITKSFGSPIDQFAYDALEVTGDKDHVVHKEDLHNAFARFCDYIKASQTPSQGPFTTKLKEIGGITDGKSRRVTDGDSRDDVYKGIRVDADFLNQFQADMPRTDQEGVTGSQQTIPQNGGQNHKQE